MLLLKQIFKKKIGFTLIEIIISIVLLGIISGIGIGLLSNVFTGYYNSRIKNYLYNEAWFILERLDRELRKSVPNSINTKDDLLNYVTFKKCFYYEKKTDNSILIYDNLTGIKLIGEKISIYNLSSYEIYSREKVYTIRKVLKKGDNLWLLQLNKNIIQDSPYHRCYLIDKYITVLKKGNNLYRCFGVLTSTQPGRKCYLFSNVIDDIKFIYYPGNLQSNSLIKIFLVLKKRDIKVNYTQEIHIKNVP